MRADNALPVADFIDKARRQKVNKKLNGEIDHDKKRNLTVGKPERVLHRQKKQRHKVVDDRLNKIADIACVKGVFKIISDSH